MKENLRDRLELKYIIDEVNIKYAKRFQKLVLVKEKYFAFKLNNIDDFKLTNDVLVFCTLILFYVKVAIVELKIN